MAITLPITGQKILKGQHGDGKVEQNKTLDRQKPDKSCLS